MKNKYEISTDLIGSNYEEIDIYWEYTRDYIDISMPHYIKNTLKKSLHTPRKQYTPHKWTEPVYSQKVQYILPKSIFLVLNNNGITCIQVINGTFMYYTRVVDPCMLPVVNKISSQQAQPTYKTNNKVTMIIDYVHTYPTIACK